LVESGYVWSEVQPGFDDTDLVVGVAWEQTNWFVLAHRP
jgi:hypothetical protein